MLPGGKSPALTEETTSTRRRARVTATFNRRLPPALLIGPNCSGFKNVPLGVNLFTGGRLDLTPGGVSIVSQSGFLTRSALAAAKQRQLGVAIGVSSGNEAVWRGRIVAI